MASLVGAAGAAAPPPPTPEAANTSTPLALNRVSSTTLLVPSVPVCRSSSVGCPPTAVPGVASSEDVPFEPLAVAVNDPHRPARDCIPLTNADAAGAGPNWEINWA